MGVVAVGRVKAADLDGVTLDAYGTLMTLVDPFPDLQTLLPGHDRDEIEQAFRTEGAYYAAHASEGRDQQSLAQLRESCVAVFNEALGSSLSADEYVSALQFELLPGTAEALERLRALGLTLAVVGNWDFSLHAWLTEHGLAGYFAAVVPAARKPEPDGILHALEVMRIVPERALHIGDDDTDEQAAHAAGVRFARAPLADVVATLT
jgi:phosphoglycolate phosphatase-like HAD superfamily hydrolase